MVSNISNDVKLDKIRIAQAGVTPVNFRANSTNTLEKTPEKDTVETKKEEKKGLSRIAKWGLGIAGAFGTLIVAMTLISRHQTKALTKLYKEKMVFKELPEKLEFKEAKTLEEAFKFTKETLGIESVDKNFSLEALNFLNKGLVDVSNANKGKLFLPRSVKFSAGEKDWIAAVQQDITSKDFGRLTVNKNFFDNKFLNEKLNSRLIDKNGVKFFDKPNVGVFFNNFKILYHPDKKYYDLLQQFYKNPEALSITQKRELFWGYTYMDNLHETFVKYRPDIIYESILKQHGKQKLTLKEFKNLELENQIKTVKEILDKKAIQVSFSTNNGMKTIYHEMGHLQDFAKNLKELDLKKWDFDIVKIIKESWKEAKNKVEKGIKSKNNAPYEYIDNRWGGTTYEGYEKLLKDKPKKFEKLYPDLYKHLTDKEIQNITGQVSWYSQTSIGEFIADVYAGLIQGKKYSDDVIALYKKYNGPLLPGM